MVADVVDRIVVGRTITFRLIEAERRVRAGKAVAVVADVLAYRSQGDITTSPVSPTIASSLIRRFIVKSLRPSTIGSANTTNMRLSSERLNAASAIAKPSAAAHA